MNENEIEIESRTQSPETIRQILEEEGYDGVAVEVASDRPAGEENSSSVPSPASGGEPAASGGESETGEPGAESETAQQQEHKEEKPKPGGFKRKIATLQSENEQLKRQLAEATAAKPAETQPATEAGTSKPAEPAATKPAEAPAEDPEPKVEDFESFEDWNKQWNRWDRRQEKREEEKRQREQESARTESASPAPTEAEKAERERWNSQLEDARDKYDDFDEVALSDQVIASPVMVAAVRELEEGCDLAYWLGKHPEESERIAKLTLLPANFTQRDVSKAFRLVGREFDKIIEQLSSGNDAATTASREARGPAAASAPTTSPQPVATKPTPVNPVGSRGANTRPLLESDPDAIRNASNQEWREATRDPRA